MYLLPQRGWTKSTLLHTSLDSHVKIRPFCTRHAFFERSRGQIRPFCPVDESYSFGRNSSPCCAAAAPNPDVVRCLYVLHVFLSPRGQNRLFCLRHWIHVHKYGLSAHVRLFLNGHGGTSGLFAPVVEILCAKNRLLPPWSFIDIVPNCGPNCGKSPLCSGFFAIRRGLCRCSARRIAR